jgi:hypothetical protein
MLMKTDERDRLGREMKRALGEAEELNNELANTIDKAVRGRLASDIADLENKARRLMQRLE